ncbi:MAG: winged helix-turn-helix domain-containing protein [Promethearchaeota archaeon]
MENKNDYKSKILNKLEDSTSGFTIIELSKKIKFHRNTVSKYLRILEAEGLVKKKKIGNALLYFSIKRKYIRKKLVNNFIQALLYALKYKYPINEQICKEVGLKLLERFQFSLGEAYREEIEKLRKISDPQAYLKLFQEFYNSFDFFQDDLDISIIELQKDKIIYRIQNSEYLDNSDDYIYYFYVVCGITEGVYLRNLNMKVECNVGKFNISRNKEESFIEISLEIKEFPTS